MKSLSLSSPIQFYEQTLIQTKTVRIFTNTKPWNEVNGNINETQMQFLMEVVHLLED